MTKLVKAPDPQQMVLHECYTLTATSLTVRGRPTFEQHEDVGAFIQRAVKASKWWLADWLRYGESRADWAKVLSQAVDAGGMKEKTAMNMRAVAAIDESRRRDDVEFALHETVASLTPEKQVFWLEKAAQAGWNQRELRLNIRAARRHAILEGQAVLKGLFRVVYCDFPWIYGNKPPSGSGAQSHYPGMTIEDGMKLPVAAHCHTDAVMFFWVTAPMLYEQPGPNDLIRSWGFTPKTGMVWDKVQHNFGNYVSIRHEHLIICTRGSCTPDRPTPMFDSVIAERQDGEHSGKPESFRKMIERLYDGPYLELFGRERREGWSVFGNDSRLWAEEVAV